MHPKAFYSNVDVHVYCVLVGGYVGMGKSPGGEMSRSGIPLFSLGNLLLGGEMCSQRSLGNVC